MPGARAGWLVLLVIAPFLAPGTGSAAPALAQGSAEAADASSAAEAATFLLVPLGARNIGFGRAVAGAAADVEGAMWNPAALAGIADWAVYYHGSNDFGTSTHAAGAVVGWRSLRIGLSLLAVDLGSIEGRDAANNPIGTISATNTLGILSLAHSISPRIDAGVNYKLIRLGGSCEGCSGLEPDATGHAFDVAVSGRPGPEALRLGLVVSNLGGDVALRSGGPGDPLPTRIRAGGEVAVLRPDSVRAFGLRVRGDLQQTFTEFDDAAVFLGAELHVRSIAFLRAGYAAAGEGRSGPSLGVGVRHRGFQLDVGRSFDDFAGFDSDSPFQVSLSYRP